VGTSILRGQSLLLLNEYDGTTPDFTDDSNMNLEELVQRTRTADTYSYGAVCNSLSSLRLSPYNQNLLSRQPRLERWLLL
jgi:hypothetical protein